ncbi:MAG: transferase [Gallionellaceae bacterium]|nr:MAG: transferase [Gallionellaceae bacterium]
MRILLAHNAYQQRGGEDGVVESEIALLRARGHEVAEYRRDNREVAGMSKPVLAANTLWSGRTLREAGCLIAEFRPDVIHAHNLFPLISPSLYWAAGRAGVPVVQTLHNFRTMCLNAMFLRDSKVCEGCLGRLPWRGIARKCYRASAAQSAVLAGMLAIHRGLGTYANKVARYIALNDFCRNKFIEGGLPAEKIVVKPNFVDWADTGEHPCHRAANGRQGLLFVGRLAAEKGVETLARAAALLPNPNLRVAGEGPEAYLLEGVAGVTRLGNLAGVAVRREMGGALALVLPSIWYENFPRTIVEAFACGLPVIASRIGALADLVGEGKTGLLCEPGNPGDWAGKMAWALEHPERMMEMGRRARLEYETYFSAEVNYGLLMDIYASVLAERKGEMSACMAG